MQGVHTSITGAMTTPPEIRDSSVHFGICERLARLVGSGDVPHILLHGPWRSGNDAIATFVLSEIYGTSICTTRMEKKVFVVRSKHTVEIDVSSSKYHLEVDPSEAGVYDQYVLQDVIKEIAQTSSLTGNMGARVKFRTIVIRNADAMSKQAQSSLRMTMEKYTVSCRLILLCRGHSNVIGPIRSRCLNVRVPALQARVIHEAKEWERSVDKLAMKITSDRGAKILLVAREMVYDLTCSGVPGWVVLETLTRSLLRIVQDDALKWEIVEWAAHYENRIHTGSKDVLHVEAFIAKYMCFHTNHSGERKL